MALKDHKDTIRSVYKLHHLNEVKTLRAQLVKQDEELMAGHTKWKKALRQLRKFGGHTADCALTLSIGERMKYPCDCGWVAIAKEMG